MSDLISRQDAIDAIRKIKAMSGTADDEILLIDKAEAMMELMRMPSAEPVVKDRNVPSNDIIRRRRKDD